MRERVSIMRDVDRFLLLEDAGFHAVIADAVPGGGGHGIVDGDDREGADGDAVLFDDVHLGDFLFERAAGELDAEVAALEPAVLFAQAGGAAVLALVVALDAVVGVVERAGEVGAGVREGEAFAVTPVVAGELELDEAVRFDFVGVDEVLGVQLVRRLEHHASLVFRFALRGKGGPDGVGCGDTELFGMGRFVVQPAVHVGGVAELGERLQHEGFEFVARGCSIHGESLFRRLAGEGFALHEAAFHRIEWS